MKRHPYTLHLADDVLTCTMKTHHASADEARAVVDPLLQAWELDLALQQGRREMRFVYQGADVVDRNPPAPGDSQVLRPSAIESVAVVEQPTVRATQRAYHPPPMHFTVSPDVETLWHRYEGSVQGRELPLEMAYFCLSLLEWRASQRLWKGKVLGKVEREYSITCEVLDKLGNLTANLGDAKTARKVAQFIGVCSSVKTCEIGENLLSVSDPILGP
jgi:hypothetical protein